ncbi:hypothetical protein HU200_041201 [Digitaria exilis]|uniref:Uncharacterized protein n=1 Tax=Digitaria exilis TaxID=1010633 RepID=A0A835B873_9POAL|nr:hypothetical protein HU200_041201 [Digitaria exilis]
MSLDISIFAAYIPSSAISTCLIVGRSALIDLTHIAASRAISITSPPPSLETCGSSIRSKFPSESRVPK